jgi:C1A family cysteine protease
MEKRILTGWKRQKEDERDYLFSTHRPQLKALPQKVDLRKYCSKIEDQSSLGSCCSNSTIACIEFLEIKHNVKYTDLSRLFHYYNTRQIEGTVNEDSGATLRDSCKAIAKYGICSEKSWPYRISRYKTKPPTSCYEEAVPHKNIKYYSLKTLTDMRQALASGFIFVIGIDLYESFESEIVESTGKVSIPERDEEYIGSHAIAIVGYTPEYFIFRNSWGVSWADKGYGYIPISYLDIKNNLADDAWVLKKVAGF